MQETTSAKLKNNTDKYILSTGKKKLHLRKMDFLQAMNSFGVVYFSIRHLKSSSPYLPNNPLSNTVVERIFSLVSSVKTKARKRMQLNLLDAVVRVRAEILFSSKCCKDFTASPEMLKRYFISDKVYAVCSTHSSGEDSNDMDLELFM